jgi:hypothetical protein
MAKWVRKFIAGEVGDFGLPSRWEQERRACFFSLWQAEVWNVNFYLLMFPHVMHLPLALHYGSV